MNMDLIKADELSPETVKNQVVRDLQQLQTRGPRVRDVLPTMTMSDSEESYYRLDSGVLPMRQTALDAGAPVGENEDLSKDQYSVDTFKKKRSPQRGVDFELNTDEDVLNAYEWAIDTLKKELRITREVAGWRGLDDVKGFIGPDGVTAHPSLSSDHVITPGTPFSDYANSNPQHFFQIAQYLVDNDGVDLDSLPAPTAYVPPSVMRDLKMNKDLQKRFGGVETQGLNDNQVESILPFSNVETVYTQVIRTNTAGQPVDKKGKVVDDRKDAVKDNILEPYNPDGAGSNKKARNVVIGTAGDTGAACMPVLTARLNNIIESAGVTPSGDWSVDNTLGFIMHQYVSDDPTAVWFKIAQEIGVHITRPENFVVIQDV